jgi:hypothetical protein
VDDYKTNEQDKIVKNIPQVLLDSLKSEPVKMLPQLVTELTKGTDDPYLKVKRFFDWISLNIEYDLEKYLKKKVTYKNNPYIDCIANGKSVCEGYADLFEEMCNIAKIENKKIIGYSRGLGYNFFNERRSIKNNHKWNAVNIKGRWYLVDPTWGAGYVQNGEYIKKYSSFFLFAEPEQLIHTHFPEKQSDQHIDKPVNMHEFMNLAFYNHLYWGSGIQLNTKLYNGMNLKDPSFVINAEVPVGKDLNIVCVNAKGKTIENNVFIQKNKIFYEANIRFPKKGRYVIHLFTGRKMDKQKLLSGSVMVYAQKSNSDLYPIIYKDYYKSEAYLESPKKLKLNKNKAYTFEISIPKAEKAMIVYNKQQIQMEKEGRYYSCTITPSASGKLMIFAKLEDNNQYSGMVEYKVK